MARFPDGYVTNRYQLEDAYLAHAATLLCKCANKSAHSLTCSVADWLQLAMSVSEDATGRLTDSHVFVRSAEWQMEDDNDGTNLAAAIEIIKKCSYDLQGNPFSAQTECNSEA